MFFGDPEFSGIGTWAGTHDVVRNETARNYLVHNIARTLAMPSISSTVHYASVYWLGASTRCNGGQSTCTFAMISEYNAALKKVMNNASMGFLAHLDGKFFMFLWVYIRMYVCVCVCYGSKTERVCVCVCVYVYIYIYICVCVYVRMRMRKKKMGCMVYQKRHVNMKCALFLDENIIIEAECKPFFFSLAGPFLDGCFPYPCPNWDVAGYSPSSLHGNVDGLLVESWTMGSLVGAFTTLIQAGVSSPKKKKVLLCFATGCCCW